MSYFYTRSGLTLAKLFSKMLWIAKPELFLLFFGNIHRRGFIHSQTLIVSNGMMCDLCSILPFLRDYLIFHILSNLMHYYAVCNFMMAHQFSHFCSQVPSLHPCDTKVLSIFPVWIQEGV